MPITVDCTGCGKQYRVSEQAAGKRLRCRECGRDMIVPMPGGGSDESDPFEALVAMEQSAAPPAPPAQRRPLIAQRPAEAIAVKGENLRDGPRGPRFGRSKSPTIATDNLSPWAVIIFVLLQLVAAILQTVQASHAGGADHGKIIGAVWTAAIANIALLFLVLGPAVYLGVFIMSKIFRCPMVDFGYLRGCGIAAVPGIIMAASAYIPPNIASQLGDSLGMILMLVIAAIFFFALKYVFDLDWVGSLVSYAFSAPLYTAALGVAANVILASVLAQVFGSKTVPPRQWFDQGPLVQLSPTTPATTQPTKPAVEPDNGPAKPNAEIEEKTAKTQENLRLIGQAIQHFATASDKHTFPPSLEALATSGDLPPHCLNSPFQQPNPGGYTYWPDRTPAMPGDVGIAYDAAELAARGSTHVLLANGNVELRSSDQFNSLVSRSNQEVLDWQADLKFKEQQQQQAMIKTTTGPSTPEQAPPAPKPQEFVSLFNSQKSPFVASVSGVLLQDQVRAIVSPVTPSPWAVVVRDDGPTQDAVELWDLSAGKSKGSASFPHEAGAQPVYSIAPDGTALARIVQFPKLGIRIWSAKENRETRTIVLNDALGTPTLVGFLNPEKVAVIWKKGEDEGMQVFDSVSGQVARQVPFQRFTPSANNGVVNPDGREFAYTSAQIPRGSPQIALFNLYAPPMAKWRWHEILDVDTADVNAPAGLAYSQDGKKLAALFAKQGAGYIICWRIADVRPLGEYEVAVPAAGGAQERGLEWVENGKAWLIMGNTLVDANDGKTLGQLNSPPTIRQWTIGPDSLAMMYQEDGKTGVAVVKLDGSKFGGGSTAKP